MAPRDVSKRLGSLENERLQSPVTTLSTGGVLSPLVTRGFLEALASDNSLRSDTFSIVDS